MVIRRAPILAALAAAMYAACGSAEVPSPSRGDAKPPRGDAVLSLAHTFAGARLVSAVDRTGTPAPRSAGGVFKAFIQPVAVARAGNDLYVADAGAAQVYRFDLALGVMAAVPAAPALAGTRLTAGSDSALYVLEPQRRRVLRLGREGTVIAIYADALNLNRPVAVAVDDLRGRVIVADALYRHLLAFHPLGGAAHVIHLRGDDRNRVLGIGSIALASDTVHISDPLCRCIAVATLDGSVRATYGHHEVGQPGAIAADRHERTFVADGFDGSIKVFQAGRLAQSVSREALGVREVSDLGLSDSWLVAADGAGARVVVLRIAAPRHGN